MLYEGGSIGFRDWGLGFRVSGFGMWGRQVRTGKASRKPLVPLQYSLGC